MSQDLFLEDKPHTNIFLKITQRYLPFWPVFVIFTAITMAIAFIYLRSQTKIYVAAAKVLLKDPQKNGGDSKVLDALNIFSEKKIVENEIIVLKSSLLMQDVVKQLDLYATVYNEGKVQTEELYGSNSPIHFEATQKDSAINGGGEIPMLINWNKGTFTLGNIHYKFGDIVNINGTAYRAIINNDYNRQVIGKNYFVVFNTVPGAAGAIAGSLNASPLSFSSTVINLTIETPVPQKGIKILDKLFEVYNIAGIQDKNEIAQRTLKFVDDRLVKVTAELDSVENNEAKLRAREGITDISAQGARYGDFVKEMEMRKTSIDLQQDVLSGVQSYVYSKGRRPGTVPAQQIVSDPILTSLLQQLYAAEFDRDRAQQSAGERSETVILANEKVNRLQNDIKENINNIRNTFRIERNNIDANIAAKNDLLAQLPGKERALLAISRQQAIKNNIYTFLLNKREETAITSASTSPDLRVLESGTSYGPIRPIPKNYYLIGLFCGLLLFVLFVQVNEPLSGKVLFRSEIESKTHVPVVGEIIQTNDKIGIAITEGKRTGVAEQFRSLRTNLSFMGLNQEDKVILVTSSISGEGKSFIATNLALSLTLTGKKVALMELDLRKPKLSRKLRIARDPGISGYLINKSTLEEIIKPTAYANLFLIPAGPIPPNPTELIETETFAVLINELKERFDYIIIDSAPIGPVTDSQLLSKYAQVTLFVVRHKVTPAIFLKLIDNLYREKKFNNMGIVFNGVRPRGTSILYYDFGGYGGYGYGYGYGYGNEKSTYYVPEEKDTVPGLHNLFGFSGFLKKLFRKRK